MEFHSNIQMPTADSLESNTDPEMADDVNQTSATSLQEIEGLVIAGAAEEREDNEDDTFGPVLRLDEDTLNPDVPESTPFVSTPIGSGEPLAPVRFLKDNMSDEAHNTPPARISGRLIDFYSGGKGKRKEPAELTSMDKTARRLEEAARFEIRPEKKAQIILEGFMMGSGSDTLDPGTIKLNFTPSPRTSNKIDDSNSACAGMILLVGSPQVNCRSLWVSSHHHR